MDWLLHWVRRSVSSVFGWSSVHSREIWLSPCIILHMRRYDSRQEVVLVVAQPSGKVSADAHWFLEVLGTSLLYTWLIFLQQNALTFNFLLHFDQVFKVSLESKVEDKSIFLKLEFDQKNNILILLPGDDVHNIQTLYRINVIPRLFAQFGLSGAISDLIISVKTSRHRSCKPSYTWVPTLDVTLLLGDVSLGCGLLLFPTISTTLFWLLFNPFQIQTDSSRLFEIRLV